MNYRTIVPTYLRVTLILHQYSSVRHFIPSPPPDFACDRVFRPIGTAPLRDRLILVRGSSPPLELKVKGYVLAAEPKPTTTLGASATV